MKRIRSPSRKARARIFWLGRTLWTSDLRVVQRPVRLFVARNHWFVRRLAVFILTHHLPVLGMDSQGSAGAKAGPACSSSIEMLSGERTNAM